MSRSESPTLLSSFVLISLLIAGESPSSRVVKEGLTCIEADKEIDDPYSLAVRAYVLALAGSSDAKDIVNSLLSIFARTTGTLYWDTIKSQSKHFWILTI